MLWTNVFLPSCVISVWRPSMIASTAPNNGHCVPFLFVETRSYSVTQATLKITVLPSQPSGCCITEVNSYTPAWYRFILLWNRLCLRVRSTDQWPHSPWLQFGVLSFLFHADCEWGPLSIHRHPRQFAARCLLPSWPAGSVFLWLVILWVNQDGMTLPPMVAHHMLESSVRSSRPNIFTVTTIWRGDH